LTDMSLDAAGNPASHEHEAWLLELGRVTRAAAQLATICFDLARIVGGIGEEQLYDDPLGGLQRRLLLIDATELPEMPQFMDALDAARRIRNDVAHAFLVRDGLFRRSAGGRHEREFYTVASLQSARTRIEAASRLGDQVLHTNGGARIGAWRQALS
jgi:hypothetical protein